MQCTASSFPSLSFPSLPVPLHAEQSLVVYESGFIQDTSEFSKLLIAVIPWYPVTKVIVFPGHLHPYQSFKKAIIVLATVIKAPT